MVDAKDQENEIDQLPTRLREAEGYILVAQLSYRKVVGYPEMNHQENE
jgi:hypothetical protein